jgi:hypothetical protein
MCDRTTCAYRFIRLRGRDPPAAWTRWYSSRISDMRSFWRWRWISES